MGDKMCTARIAAYEAEIARVTAIKAERDTVIASLCDEINALWAELSFSPADEYETCIAARGAGLGWATTVIDMLREKLAALTTEKVRDTHARDGARARGCQTSVAACSAGGIAAA